MSGRTRSDLPLRFLARVLDDARLRAVWLEGPDREAAWDAAAGLDLHVAVEDPDFDAVWAGHYRLLGSVGEVSAHDDEDAPVEGRACRATFVTGETVLLSVERASLLAKRPRDVVVPLLDRSGRFRFVLTYRRPWEPAGGAASAPRSAAFGGNPGSRTAAAASTGPHLVPPKKPETTTADDLPDPRPARRLRSRRTSTRRSAGRRAPSDTVVPGNEGRPRLRDPGFLVEPPDRKKIPTPPDSSAGASRRLVAHWFEEDPGTGAPIECRASIAWESDAGPYRVSLEKGGRPIVDDAVSPDLELAKKFCSHRHGAPLSGWRAE